MQTRNGAIITFETIAKDYPPERFILLMPQVARHLLTTVPMWSLDVATVKVDPENTKQAYEIGWKSGEFGLTKVSLDAMATAADSTVMAKRIDDHRDAGFAEYEAHAVMTTPSGGVRGQGRTCEWNADIEKEKVIQQANRWVDQGINQRWKGFSDQTRQAKLDQRVAEQWLRAREFGKRMVESKAGNRAIRALLGIAPKYDYDELKNKEFAVVRFVFTPDLEDREVKLMVVSAGLQAQRMLYGQPTAEQITQPTALPPAPNPAMQLTEAVAEDDSVEAGPTENVTEEIAEVASEDWGEAVLLIGDIMQRIETVENKSTKTKLRNRLTKAITNEDAATVNAILDYLISKE